MIRVFTETAGILSKVRGIDKQTFEIPDNSTIRDLLLADGFKPEEVNSVNVTLNGKYAAPDEILRDNDMVQFSIIVGGG